MPLEWNCIVKTGTLVKSPPIEGSTKSMKKWRARYFVLYDPFLNEKSAMMCSREDLTVPTPDVTGRRKSSLVGNVFQKFRSNLDKKSKAFQTATLFYYENSDKEKLGASPKSKKLHLKRYKLPNRIHSYIIVLRSRFSLDFLFVYCTSYDLESN